MPEPPAPRWPTKDDAELWGLRQANLELRATVDRLMAELRHRQHDPPDYDPRQDRRVDPTQWPVEIGYGKWSLKLYGYALLIALIGVAIVGSNIYAAREIRESVDAYMTSASREHRLQADEDRRTRCVLALTIDQRAALLGDRYPGAWTRACWWMHEGGG